MDRRASVSLVVGAVSAACAAGVLERDALPPEVVLEPLEAGRASQLLGVVRDRDTGHAIPGAFVIVTCRCITGERERLTNPGGVFSLRELPPGEYTVQVFYRHVDVTRRVVVTPSVRARLDVVIDPNRRYIIS
ncbi:carboxypeptidase-like regulatory domain-containing protein [Nannocystis punicea]|uniref:Carboxypeptidase-like regulatory domain-containing protein n=1 Tax=Nannocystis punicea TaxID=2995304 RepID=A0ABY7GU79_9BACT|nr:carboxypeptidase-like regulatory domain-containing protein [Nannocystis poenicansa]WAS90473.1 carboxypeptidase-like regulatory domain-containing protein [Nannocystis poenicansa]